MRKSGLGKGLDALLNNNDDSPLMPEKSPIAGDKDIIQLPVDLLISNPDQPRKNFNETELQELADSIKEYGIIQPIIAANAEDGTYYIIAGERRTRAAKLAGLQTVPAVIREYGGQKRMEVSLIENIQRSDLNPIEEAVAYKNLIDFSGLSQDELALRVGKNRSTVANALRLLKLPVEMQKNIEAEVISPGHARALLSVNAAHEREKLYAEVIKGNLSVRETEKRADAINNKKTVEKKSKGRPPEVDAMEEKFIHHLAVKVEIKGGLNKGCIQINYSSMEELERLYEILVGS
jgi:ParB family chromosome partitioning protein